MTFRLPAFRLLALLALVVCMTLIVDGWRSAPAFCSFRAGCEQVVHSPYGRPLGLPLSWWGLIAFGGFFTLTLFPAAKPARLLGPLALLAGLIGLGLVAVQVWVLKQTCPFCLIVDTAAILLAAVELGLPPRPDAVTPRSPRRLVWIVLVVLALGAPIAWSMAKPLPAVPPQVRALWKADRINLVELTDFTCPYCRQTHGALAQFVAREGEHLHVVRLVVPLEHHTHSLPAARAYLCAVQQGLGEAMADALFAADDHSPAALRERAERLGLDLARYDTCLADPALDAQIDETRRWVEAADLGGLPQIWLQDLRLVGRQTPDSLRSALNHVRRTTGR